MKKIYLVTNCTFCPHSCQFDGKFTCTYKDNHREITREDEFEWGELNEAIRCKFPEWCMLEDYNK